MTDEDKIYILQQMMDQLAKNGNCFDVDGAPALAVKMKDGTYRTKPAAATQYYPEKIYLSSRGVIITFSPEDPQEWVSIEVPARKIDECFPLFLIAALDWARARYRANNPSVKFNHTELPNIPLLFDKIWALEDELVKAQTQDDKSELSSLPNFGLF